MNRVKLCYFFMLALMLTACKFNCSIGDSGSSVKAKTVTSEDNAALNGAIIKNDIDIEVSGVKLDEAYLMDESDNILTENVTRVGEKIYLVLKTDTGWAKENGRSFIGASERISTAAGKVFVDATDIFKDYEETGLPADKADAITLSARITENDEGVENFVVKFRVWDKKGTGEIKGQYKFSIKK